MPGMAPAYPGQPMFYGPQPGMPPQRGVYFPPQPMMQRPRYGGMPQNGPPMGPGMGMWCSMVYVQWNSKLVYSLTVVTSN